MFVGRRVKDNIYSTILDNGGYGLPIQNIRLTLQYTGYTKFNGGRSNYDGTGRNAGANNTLFANVWVAF